MAQQIEAYFAATRVPARGTPTMDEQVYEAPPFMVGVPLAGTLEWGNACSNFRCFDSVERQIARWLRWPVRRPGLPGERRRQLRLVIRMVRAFRAHNR